MFWDIFKKKNKSTKNITGKEVCDIFYELLYYYDKHSANIAVIKNRKMFDWQIKVWKEKMNKARGDTVNKLSDDRYLFMIDELEINIVMIKTKADLHINQIKYRRYMG